MSSQKLLNPKAADRPLHSTTPPSVETIAGGAESLPRDVARIVSAVATWIPSLPFPTIHFPPGDACEGDPVAPGGHAGTLILRVAFGLDLGQGRYLGGCSLGDEFV
jgi:hypothetical protein